MARYDDVVDFYSDQIGAVIGDPAALAALELAADAGLTGATVLDLACGSGRSSRELARRGALVTGVDISAAMVDRARETETADPLGVTYLVADAADPTAVSGPYDGVFCMWGLTDIDDLDGVLDTVARVLRPGGFFACCFLHPCFPGLASEVLSSWPPGAGYYTEGWWRAETGRSPLRRRVGANHRTLATYINALTTRGLRLETVREPQPTADWFAQVPDGQPVPTHLALRCRRE
jgi:ubiquinone/menaquinone biosynthesis C-methylase UbiE